jgi:hypothetical protein
MEQPELSNNFLNYKILSHTSLDTAGFTILDNLATDFVSMASI